MYRSVMLSFAVLMTVTVVGPSGCTWGDPSASNNIQPAINNFTVGGEVVERLRLREGEKPTVTVVVWDGNGDEMVPENFTWEAALGSLVGEGPSVRYEMPAGIVWQNPPQDITDTVTVCVTDGAPGSEPVCKTLDVDILPPCPEVNEEPIINSITATPDDIELGDAATVVIDAVDPEGEALSYEWTPPFGYIEGTGSSVVWVSTDVCCLAWYDVQVVVSDGCTSTWSTVGVYVRP